MIAAQANGVELKEGWVGFEDWQMGIAGLGWMEGIDMAAQGVNLTAEFEAYAAELVKDGRYASANEVLAAAINALKREECNDAAKAQALEQALEEGFASGVAEGDVFARVRARAGLSAHVR